MKGENFVKKLLSFVVALAMALTLFPSVLVSANTQNSVEYYVDGVVSPALASGDVTVKVNHGALASGSTVVGAIYEAERLFAVKQVSVTAESTDIPFGTLTLAGDKAYTFKSILLADMSTLKIAAAPTAAPAVGTKFYVQAEEFASFNNANGTVYTGEVTQTAGFPLGDVLCTNYDTVFVPSANSGGIAWNATLTAYGVVLRAAGTGYAAETAGVTGEWTFDAPTAGSYKISAYQKGSNQRNMLLDVNNVKGSLVAVPTAGYELTELGTFDLNSTGNTMKYLVANISAANLSVDYFEFELLALGEDKPIATAAPTETPTETPTVEPTVAPTEDPALANAIYLQAEDFATYNNTVENVYAEGGYAANVSTLGLTYGLTTQYAGFVTDAYSGGAAFNEWTSAYGLAVKASSGSQDLPSESITWTYEVPADGTYQIAVRQKADNIRDTFVRITDATGTYQDSKLIKPTSSYSIQNYGTFNLKAGVNTISYNIVTDGNASENIDYVRLIPQLATDPIRVEGEEFDQYIAVTAAGANTYTKIFNPSNTKDTSAIVNDSTGQFATAVNETGSQLVEPYTAGSGNGVPYNAYAMTTAICIRSNTQLVYTVNAIEAGTYTLKVCAADADHQLAADGSDLYTVLPTVYVGADIQWDVLTPITKTDAWDNPIVTEIGTVTLAAGPNTITFEIPADGQYGTGHGYFDYFELQLVQ